MLPLAGLGLILRRPNLALGDNMSVGVNVRHEDHRSFAISETMPGHYTLQILCDGLPIVQISLREVSEAEAGRLANHLQSVARFVITPDIGPGIQALCDDLNAARARAEREGE